MNPEFFGKILENYLYPLEIGPTVGDFVTKTFNPEVPLKDLASLLDENQAFSHFLQRFLEINRKSGTWNDDSDQKNDDPTRRALGIPGRVLSRNFVATIGLMRALKSGLPRRTNVPLDVEPGEMISHALSLEEHCGDNLLSNVDKAFFAGLVYDWLIGLTLVKKGGLRGDSEYFDVLWDEAMFAAHIAYRLGRLLRKLELDEYVFSGTLLINTGKYLMSVIYPEPKGDDSWIEFTEFCSKITTNRFEMSRLFESKRFPITHNELSSLCANFSPFFKRIEKAIYFYQDPYYLEKQDYALFDLSSLMSIGAALARNLGVVDDDGYHFVVPGGKVFNQNLNPFHRKWLENKSISERTVIKAIKEAGKFLKK